ncbi:MAG: serine hydrolase, partial [Bacteroidota bacterium]
MKKILSLVLILLCNLMIAQNEVYQFKKASPESKGFSSDKLQILAEHLESSGSSSMMLLKDGEVFFEWGDTNKKHLIHSMRKALLNSLYGIAIAQGKIDTSATLRELKITDIGGLSETELSARVADVLKSRSGIYHNAAAVNNAMLRGRPKRNTHEPGTYYYYNNWDFNVAGAILEQQTGESIYEQFHKYIAQPLGMQHYQGKVVTLNIETDDDFDLDTDGIYQFE